MLTPMLTSKRLVSQSHVHKLIGASISEIRLTFVFSGHEVFGKRLLCVQQRLA